jgi:hypothetical protein
VNEGKWSVGNLATCQKYGGAGGIDVSVVIVNLGELTLVQNRFFLWTAFWLWRGPDIHPNQLQALQNPLFKA